MSKYAILTNALRRRPGSHWRVTFEELEQVLKKPLPKSAYSYPAWWSNNPSNNTMTPAWLTAGWKTAEVDVPGRKVTFRKSENTPPLPPSVNEPAAQALTPGIQVALAPSEIESLNMIAVASGETIEEAATRLLQQAIAMAAPAVRAERARKAIESRSDLPEIDLAEILEQSRNMH